MSLTVTLENGVAFFKGVIDENADLKKIFSQLQGDVTLNLKDVKGANSVGLRDWILLVTEYSNRHKVRVECLTYPLAVQARMIRNVFGNGEVVSILAPYYCTSCEKEELVKVSAAEIQRAGQVPSAQCPHCKTEMSFDELPHYFDVLRQRAG